MKQSDIIEVIKLLRSANKHGDWDEVSDAIIYLEEYLEELLEDNEEDGNF
jgi:hypothetical protein